MIMFNITCKRMQSTRSIRCIIWQIFRSIHSAMFYKKDYVEDFFMCIDT
jgi:hypothetical protein